MAISKFKSDGRPDWEQRNRRTDKPKESDESYAAFIAYRDMPVDVRSLDSVAQTCNKSVSLIGRWSSEWAWDERLAAWNRAERARLDEATAKEFDKMRLAQRKARQDTLKLLQGLLGNTVKSATSTTKKTKVDGKEVDEVIQVALSPADLHRLTRSAAIILEQSRREMNDLPTERQEHTGPNGGPIRTENQTHLKGNIPARMVEIDAFLKARRDKAVVVPPEHRE